MARGRIIIDEVDDGVVVSFITDREKMGAKSPAEMVTFDIPSEASAATTWLSAHVSGWFAP